MVTMQELGVSSDSTPAVHYVRRDDVKAFWPLIQPWLDATSKELLEDTSIPEIHQWLDQGYLSLFVGHHKGMLELAAIARVLGEKNRQVEVLWLSGRNLKKYREPGVLCLEKFGACFGASKLVIGGRPGLKRMLAPVGLKFHRIELTKEISFIQTEEGLQRRQ